MFAKLIPLPKKKFGFNECKFLVETVTFCEQLNNQKLRKREEKKGTNKTLTFRKGILRVGLGIGLRGQKIQSLNV